MTSRRKPTTALGRLLAAAVVGVVATVAALLAGYWYIAAQGGWDLAGLTYLALTVPAVWRLDATQTKLKALGEDPTRALTDLVLLGAAVASLGALGVVLARVGQTSGVTSTMLTVFAVLSVLVSWAVVHVTFMLRYASIYYTEPIGGVNFNQDEPPAYIDFAYLSLTVGMTFQVSDTDLASRDMRRTALRHALLSYMFGTVILATTVNFVAGLAR